MKYSTSLLFLLGLHINHILMSLASPIAASKRSFPPFEARYSPIFFIKPESWNYTVYAYIYTKDESIMLETDINQWPGKEMLNGFSYFPDETQYSNYYSVNIPYGHYKDSYIIFSDSEHQIPEAWDEGYDLIVYGVYGETGIIGTLDAEHFHYNDVNLAYGNFARIFFRPNNRVNNYGSLKVEVYAHYKIGNGEWNSILGDKMNGDPYSGYYSLSIDLGEAEEFTICFTDGKGNWDNNNGQNFHFKKFQTYIIDRIRKEDAPLFY
ncbi:hypothetical protein H8356DRAFT_1743030 [Neocallimastix lanati (nom. inval.)]|nr:hypothetical protein H8356DRAFT_1759738 [Neocallimastix sp. JGI-2020a]KAG4084854.1 hypothetical protein H8356DRAFT_1743030 [Neocallimastix sp. JGI-2020a]